MPIYIYNGGILRANGGLAANENCCCQDGCCCVDGEPVPGITSRDECEECTVTLICRETQQPDENGECPEGWTFVFAGFGNCERDTVVDSCENCNGQTTPDGKVIYAQCLYETEGACGVWLENGCDSEAPYCDAEELCVSFSQTTFDVPDPNSPPAELLTGPMVLADGRWSYADANLNGYALNPRVGCDSFFVIEQSRTSPSITMSTYRVKSTGPCTWEGEGVLNIAGFVGLPIQVPISFTIAPCNPLP